MNWNDLRIRLLRDSDIASGLSLCRVSGWNQLSSDWQRLIRYQPDGCFAAEVDQKLVGTVTTTSFGQRLAWIGMMLVDPAYRRRGIATGLMQTALDHLQQSGVACVKLDATAQGEPVYEQLGFRAELTYQRWHRGGLQAGSAIDSARLHELHYELDRQAFGVDRRQLLDWFAMDSMIVTAADGYGMMRAGHLAHYLGPVVAATTETAMSIVNTLVDSVTGDVFWDVFDDQTSAQQLARSLGFLPRRSLTRMCKGESPGGTTALQYAIAGPAVG